MAKVTFITGNQGKADFLAKYVNHPIDHKKLDLDEIQSLDLSEIAEYKARQAYSILASPVLVEDAGLAIHAMGKLPGPYIKWFHQEMGLEGICRIVQSLGSNSAVAQVCFAYYDGKNLELFEGSVEGSISSSPCGSNGFGFDPIFVPAGANKTFAEMTDEELSLHSLRTTTVYPKIKDFLISIDKD